ncbi:MAG: hypothetical protein H6807_12455 [Planctomycetes bacterium]|nr:hypothetical protein [Planctomycetota bacterium]
MTDRESERGPLGPRHLRAPLAQLLLLVAVVLSHGWMTGLEFQLDDFEQVQDAARPGEPAVLLGQDTLGQRYERGHGSMVAFFRPVLHASLVVDVFLFGPSPFALHAISVLWHLAVVLLFRRLMRRLLLRSELEPRRDRIERWSFLAALLVAIHPGIWGAVSWVAARGDVLAAFFFLLALDLLASHRQDARRRLPPLVILSLIAAMLAKEGAVVTPVLVALVDLAFLRRRREEHLKPLRTWPFDLVLVLLAPAYLVGRRLLFGDQADFYAGHERILTVEIVLRMLGDVLPTFGMLVGGSFQDAGGAIGGWLRSVLGTALLLVPIPWLLRRPLRRLRFVAFAAGLYLLAAAAPLRFFEEAAGFDASRLFYLPFLVIAPLLALPFLALSSPIRSFRRLGIAFTVLAALTWTIAGWSHLRAQLAAARLVERVRNDLLAIASEPGGHEVVQAVIGVPTDVDRAPTYGTFLGLAMKRPFVDPPLWVWSIQEDQRKASLRNRMLTNPQHPYPVRILEWQGGTDGRLVKISGILPPPCGHHPLVELPAGGDELALEPPVRPRDVPALALSFEGAARARFRCEVLLETVEGATITIAEDFDPGEAGWSERHLVELTEREDWLFAQPIRRLRWQVEGDDAPRLVAIDFGAEVPAIELIESGEVSLEGEDPGIRFRDPGGFDWFRIRVFLQAETRSFTYPRQRFERLEDGSLRIHLSSPGFMKGEDALQIGDLRRAGGRSFFDEKGVQRIALVYRVEALRGNIGPAASPQAASILGKTAITR